MPFYITLKMSDLNKLDDDNPYYPIMAGLRDGAIKNVVQILQGSAEEAWQIPEGRTVIRVGDDTHEALGPTAFHRPSLVNALKRIHGCVLQVADFRPDVMNEIAALVAAGRGNVMIIETRTDREIEWIEFLKTARCGEKDGPGLLVVTVQPTH